MTLLKDATKEELQERLDEMASTSFTDKEGEVYTSILMVNSFIGDIVQITSDKCNGDIRFYPKAWPEIQRIVNNVIKQNEEK
jgi:hypothetical protein